MSPEAQRIAIAEACPECVEWHDGVPYWRGSWSSAGEGNERFAEFNPLSDLSAMAEAEKVLTNNQRIEARWHLVQINDTPKAYSTWAPDEYKTLNIWEMSLADIDDCLMASAAQRAEALLRTLNLWRDE